MTLENPQHLLTGSISTTYMPLLFLRGRHMVTKENTSRTKYPAAIPQNSGMKQVQSSERIDRGAIDYFSQVDIFVWSVRHGKQAWTVSIGRDAPGGVEACLQQTRTHLKSWRVARDRSYAPCQRDPEPLLLAACGRLPLLQYLPSEWNAVALAPLQHAAQSALLLLEVFLGIDAPVAGEPALLRYHVEICAAAAPSTPHHYRLARLIRPDVEGSGSLLHLLLQLLEPLNDFVHALERVFPLVL